MTSTSTDSPPLATASAATYAGWFSCLAEPSRVRLLHSVATSPAGLSIGSLASALCTTQSTVSHHVRKLAAVGFVRVHKEGRESVVTINEDCCAELPHAADAVMGLVDRRTDRSAAPPSPVPVRALEPDDWPSVLRIYAEGIATGIATFETTVPSRDSLEEKWLPGHRWVAEMDGQVVGWTAISPVSARECYAGVGEASVYIAAGHRGRGVGKALLRKQVTAADAGGLWTLQSTIFTENRASIALHHSVGYRTVGVRERIAKLDGTWRDTAFIERRSPVVQ
jgi:L-amino acid N-acyltransferase YncA/DNA-binding transcriptional ArsR family regulator